MKKVAITLVATLMMLGVSWSANSANANEALANAAVKAMHALAGVEGAKMPVPGAECYKSEFLRFVNRDPKSVSKKERKILEILTVDNLNRLIELTKEGNFKNKINSLFKKKKGDVFTKDEEIIGVSMFLGFIGIPKCAELMK